MGEMLQVHGLGTEHSEKIRSHCLRCDIIFLKMSLYACKMCEPERSLNVADISGKYTNTLIFWITIYNLSTNTRFL